jgi:hypothetical protein
MYLMGKDSFTCRTVLIISALSFVTGALWWMFARSQTPMLVKRYGWHLESKAHVELYSPKTIFKVAFMLFFTFWTETRSVESGWV